MKARRLAAGVVELGTALFYLVALAIALPNEAPFADACTRPRRRARRGCT